jgi:hypothetical protein
LYKAIFNTSFGRIYLLLQVLIKYYFKCSEHNFLRSLIRISTQSVGDRKFHNYRIFLFEKINKNVLSSLDEDEKLASLYQYFFNFKTVLATSINDQNLKQTMFSLISFSYCNVFDLFIFNHYLIIKNLPYRFQYKSFFELGSLELFSIQRK